MNIQGANSDPYYRFFRAQENLGSNIKLAYGALHAISQNEGATLPEKGTGLIALPTGGEPWGSNTRWRGTKRRIPLIRRFLSQMGLVLVTSAFEDFLTNVIAEHSRYSGFFGTETRAKEPWVGDSEGGDIVGDFYRSLGWDIRPIEYLLPLYDYFILVRNCVVHRSGRASKALVEKAGSRSLTDCIEAWPSKPGKRIPQLPQLQEHQDIPLLPRHAILFSEVCQRAAKEIDSLLVGFLGVDGMVYMAAYHGLLANDRSQINARRSPEQIVNLMLTERCHVQVSHKYEVIQFLKKLDLWRQCRARYNKLYPKASKSATSE
jgi:hypothetical protein